MTIPASELQSHGAATALGESGGEAGVEAVAGRSPMQLAKARFVKDKLSMAAFVVVALYILLALIAPFAVKLGVLDPYSFHSSAKFLDINAGAIPKGAFRLPTAPIPPFPQPTEQRPLPTSGVLHELHAILRRPTTTRMDS